MDFLRMRKVLSRIFFLCLPAIVLLIASLLYYDYVWDSFQFPAWQVYHLDHADYRFVAEHFWGVPHDYSTYAQGFKKGWGSYLSQVPFREIGVGTYYLMAKWAYQLVTSGDAFLPSQLSYVIPFSFKIFLFLSFLIFFVSCRERYGLWVASVCLILLALSPRNWILTESLLSEPFLRGFFVLMVASLLLIKPDESNMFRCFLIFICLAFITAHIKSQWMFHAFIVASVFLFKMYRKKLWKQVAAVLLTLGSIPLSLFLVHYIGWGVPSIVSGIGLQAHLRTGHQSTEYACNKSQLENYVPTYCQKDKPLNGYYKIYFDEDDFGKDFEVLDAIALRYYLSRPKQLISKFIKGLSFATNYPKGMLGNAAYSGEPKNVFLKAIDMACWLVLLVGLFFRKTQVFAVAGLGLWIIPSIGNMFAIYFTRYHRPMASIPLIISVIILVELFTNLRHRLTSAE